jgi:hypothetical protein
VVASARVGTDVIGDRFELAEPAGARVRLAEIYARHGELDAARAEVLAALDLVDRTPLLECRALATLAPILRALGETEAALARAREAAAILNVLGGLDDGEATVRLALIEALATAGETRAAREAASATRDRLLERAAKITNFTYRASFLQNVPENAATIAWPRRFD